MSPKVHRFFLLASLILVAFHLPNAVAQVYSITDVGSLDPGGIFDVSYGNAVNNYGHVAGTSYVARGSYVEHAFLWTQQTGIRDLYTLGGLNSFGWGINDFDDVAGQADLPNGTTHAVLWEQGTVIHDLGTLGGSYSVAYAVNYFGQVAGEAFDSAGNEHAFVWTREAGMRDLGTLGGSTSIAYAINDFGQVAGTSQITGDNNWHAFLWTQQGGMQDLGTIYSYNPSYGYGINNWGEVAGYAGLNQVDNTTYGFVWNGHFIEIPFAPLSTQNFPAAINDLHQVVGSYNGVGGVQGPFFYDRSLGFHDLNKFIARSSGWGLTGATGIASTGYITGSGVVPAQKGPVNHAFLMTPNQ